MTVEHLRIQRRIEARMGCTVNIILLLVASGACQVQHACPLVPFDRFAREDAAWRENCATIGSDEERQWLEYVRLHTNARHGAYSTRVLVLHHMNLPLGNAINFVLKHVFRLAMLTGRAIFVNSTMTKITNRREKRTPSFDIGEHLIGRDGVDWWLTGFGGDALTERWRTVGMREVRISYCQSSAGLAESTAKESVDWLAVDMQNHACVTNTFFSETDSWDRCRLNAFMRPRPHVQEIIRAILNSARENACGDAVSVSAQPRLIALQLRTGHADGVDTFATGSANNLESWAIAEASFQSMPDRLGLASKSIRTYSRESPEMVQSKRYLSQPSHRRVLNILQTVKLNPTAFEFKCIGRTNTSRSLLYEFGGVKSFVECALAMSASREVVPHLHTSLSHWNPKPAPRSISQMCGMATAVARGCSKPSLFISTDSASFNRLLNSSFKGAIVSADLAGVVGHSMKAFALSVKRAGRHALYTMGLRAVVDWLVLSMADVIFSASAHFASTFLSTALERSTLTTTHIEYFDGLAKLLCARLGTCAMTAFGQNTCELRFQTELARNRAIHGSWPTFEQCISDKHQNTPANRRTIRNPTSDPVHHSGKSVSP